ncbi:MAG: ATP-binding protein [Bacteroidales bacterium]|nr:ATP-binding protein [Bacteroidales bacterium]MDZ4205353.1 ATP-binding protein [Bacteroidales bacterium]
MKTGIINKGVQRSFIISAALVILAIILGSFDRKAIKPSTAFRNFEITLSEKREMVRRELINLSQTPANDLFSLYELKNNNQQKVVFFAYNKDSLRFWSSQAIEIPAILDSAILRKEVFRLSSGFYLAEVLQKEADTYLALLLIKHVYPYENEYLVSGFNTWFSLPDEVEIRWESTGYDIEDKNQDFLFALEFPLKPVKSRSYSLVLLVLYLVSFLLIINGLHHLYRGLSPSVKSKNLLFAAFLFDIILLRALLQYFKIPHVLYETQLFSPALLAISNFIPSLGDLLVNTAIILSIAWFFYKSDLLIGNKPQTTLGRNISGFTLLLHVFIFFQVFMMLFRSIIFNSVISFDLNNIFGLTTESLLGYLAIAGLLLAYFFISARLISLAISLYHSRRDFLITASFTALISILLSMFFDKLQLLHQVIIVAYILIFILVKFGTGKELSFIHSIVFLAFFSFIAAYTLRVFKTEKERQDRILLAIELAGERDKVAEFRFQAIANNMLKDDELIKQLDKSCTDPLAETETIWWITQKYFNKFWMKYDLLLTICYPGKQLQIKPTNYVLDCREYFESYISSFSEPTQIKDLNYLFPGTGEINYIAKLEFGQDRQDFKLPVTIYFEINSKSAKKGLGYPELLIDSRTRKPADMSNYSYAIYLNGALNKSVGKYSYGLYDSKLTATGNDFTFFSNNTYNHMHYQVSDSKVIIVSQSEPAIFEIIAPFSYLFIFFGLFALLFAFISGPPRNISRSALSFRNQIQYSMFGLIFVSFVVIGISTLIYLTQLNYNKNLNNLSEKSHSVLIELEHKLADRQQLSSDMGDYLESLLTKFSQVFFSDINLYDTTGRLLATSRPQIFTEELISKYINPEAFKQMAYSKKSSFIHNESIGNYQYLSAYLPLRNEQNNLIAYVNLPFFARQGELRQEISTFLVAFTNIYIVLVAIGLFLALLLSNYLLRPLSLMKLQLRKIKIGNVNQKIPWKSKDEVGQLIGEYNRMTEELAQSAEMLARSERENAWREMARQVAHEIKNPLTPMKLNIQHLQKAWNEKAPDWDQRLQRFTTTLTQQIDALSEIATAFSDFATLPQSVPEEVNLHTVAGNAAALYSDLENIKIIINPAHGKLDYVVIADEKQLLRVFNNLIKNSVQAIGSMHGGMINISMLKEDRMIQVVVSDNGTGISPEQQARIFTPYFTTKSSGMGLGLAMVKNIITGFGGTISFVSHVSNGTEFHVYLPAFEKEQP